MPKEIYLVKVGMNMTDGIVEEWCVADGGRVEKGELVYRLETEKVNLDVDAEASGVVKHIVAEGVPMKPGDVVGYIYEAGESVPDILPRAIGPAAIGPAAIGPAAVGPAAGPGAPARAPATPAPTGSVGSDGRLLSSPAARRMSRELNVDITALNGSGPGGRIVEADVQAAAAAAPPPAQGARLLADGEGNSPVNWALTWVALRVPAPADASPREDVEQAASRAAAAPEFAPAGDRTVPVRAMRRTIATRMYESLQTSAQLTMDMDVNMDDAVKLRTQLIDEWQDEGLRPTYTDLVIRASAKALEKHPNMNSLFGETEITLLGDIHVGMAVALEEGLIVRWCATPTNSP